MQQRKKWMEHNTRFLKVVCHTYVTSGESGEIQDCHVPLLYISKLITQQRCPYYFMVGRLLTTYDMTFDNLIWTRNPTVLLGCLAQ